MSQSLEPAPARGLAYRVPPAGSAPPRELVALRGPAAGQRFLFYESMTIGRLEPGAPGPPGVLYVPDPSVSGRHCVIVQDRDGRCFVRDMSLNGTRVDGHRLVPGAETEMRPGQVLALGQGHEFRLEGPPIEAPARPRAAGTLPVVEPTLVTVLVGDIRGYTELVREAPADLVQPCVDLLFRQLERLVDECDGSVKEYPGDAILAYWEAGASENCAVRACRAALALDSRVRDLARDPAAWRLPGSPLRMDWALATGKVMIGSRGGPHPVGLSMIGTAVIKAFRLEKLADEASGAILVCEATRAMAEERFRFRDLGAARIPGFATPENIFALVEAR